MWQASLPWGCWLGVVDACSRKAFPQQHALHHQRELTVNIPVETDAGHSSYR